jgi:hypothetical protein
MCNHIRGNRKWRERGGYGLGIGKRSLEIGSTLVYGKSPHFLKIAPYSRICILGVAEAMGGGGGAKGRDFCQGGLDKSRSGALPNRYLMFT